MKKGNMLLPEYKDYYNKEEVKALLETTYSDYTAELAACKEEISKLKKQNEYWAMEHEKSLVLIVENASQKIELQELNKKLNAAFHQLEIESKTDYLTKLLNRGALIESLRAELKRMSRFKEGFLKKVREIKAHPEDVFNENNIFPKEENLGQLTCAILDIDNFKKINDTYGHLVGDMVLKTIGSILNDPAIMRGTDISGRFGGEEFLIVFPHTNCENAMTPLNKIHEEIQNTEFRADEKSIFHITVSIGVTEFLETDKSLEDMIKRADDALYFAKQNGRNRIVIYNDALQI